MITELVGERASVSAIDPLVAEAFERDKQIKQYKRAGDLVTLLLAEQLYTLRERQEYKLLGCDSFEEYIGQPEIGISRAWAFTMMRVYERYVLELNVDRDQLALVGPKKLDMARHVVTSENVDEVLQSAEALSVSDLQRDVEERELAHLDPSAVVRTYALVYAELPDCERMRSSELRAMCKEAATVILKCMPHGLSVGLQTLRNWQFDYAGEIVGVRQYDQVREGSHGFNIWHDIYLVGFRSGGCAHYQNIPTLAETEDAAGAHGLLFDFMEQHLEKPRLLIARFDREGWTRSNVV